MADCNTNHKAAPRVWEPSCPVRPEAVYFHSLPSYHEFFIDIFLKNQLCVVGPACTDSWASRKFWVTKHGAPDFQYLRQHFGGATAPVTNCKATESDCSDAKCSMKVSDFISYWEEHRASGRPSWGRSLYLKDWHFKRDFPSYNAYSPPPILCSDWLNEFWDVRQDHGGEGGTEGEVDDYRFVYMGPKNTWTPFHSDVLRSYSWSANICGRKKWIFFPPGEEDKMRDKFGQLVYNLRDPALKDSTKYPHADGVLADKSIEVIQNPGEVVFVPSGWHHQVFNLSDTISINHNWMNGCSIHLTWNFLKSKLARVKEEIADCVGMDGFDSQCQKILKADSGMDYVEFYNLLATISRHRIEALDVVYEHLTTKMGGGSTLCNEEATLGTPIQMNSDLSNIRLCLWNAAQLRSAKNLSTSHVENKHIKNNIIIIISSQNHKHLFCPNLETENPHQIYGQNKVESEKTENNSKILELKNSFDCKLQFSKPNRYDKPDNLDLHQIKPDSPDRQTLRSCEAIVESPKDRKDFSSQLHNSKDHSGISHANMDEKRKEGLEKSDDDFISESERVEVEIPHHASCPHWSHCDCRLAVFDLQQVLVTLIDMAQQPGWENVRDAGCGVLLEDYNTLVSAIEDCLGKIRKFLL